MPNHHLLSTPRRGQALLEFAVIALLLYLVLAAILTFGFMMYSAQSVQQAADLGARELSRVSLAADITFEDAIEDATVTGLVYDPDLLVFDLDTLGAQNFFEDIVPTWPILNQQLSTLMIVDRPDFDGDGSPDANLLRYPGALITSATSASGYGVAIPLVTGRAADGTETIRWVQVVEEIDTEDAATDNTGANPDPFQISSPMRGVVALRVNYPFQSAAMSGFQPSSSGPFEPNLGEAIVANDAGVMETNADQRGGDLIPQASQSGNRYAGTYGGTYGLGVQAAMGQQTRPFRKLIAAQAIYRREVFQ